MLQRRIFVFCVAFAMSYSNKEIADVANYVTARFGTKGSSLTEQIEPPSSPWVSAWHRRTDISVAVSIHLKLPFSDAGRFLGTCLIGLP
jgi:hypothetical protein